MRISPGTNSLAKISTSSPERRTRTLGTASFFSAAMAFSALNSCQKPMVVFKMTIIRMTAASIYSCNAIEIIAAASKMITINSLTWSNRMERTLFFPCSINSLIPYFCSRCLASSLERPIEEFVLSSFKTSSVEKR